jgi:hypothetical protein
MSDSDLINIEEMILRLWEVELVVEKLQIPEQERIKIYAVMDKQFWEYGFDNDYPPKEIYERLKNYRA